MKSLSDDELHRATLRAAKSEQMATLDLLEHLHEVQTRRLYAKLAYSSLFAYVVQALGYSEAQASERVAAMRLVYFSVPEAKTCLENGTLSLTTAASTERFLRAAKKRGHAIEKSKLLENLVGKSSREVERVFVSEMPGLAQEKQRIRPVSATLTEIQFTADEEFMKLYCRAVELRGNVPLLDLMKSAYREFLNRRDLKARALRERATQDQANCGGSELARPLSERQVLVQARQDKLRGRPSHSTYSRYIPVTVRKEVILRSGGRCEYRDPATQKRCEGRKGLQLDHRHAFALGGSSSDVGNIRQLCPAHNLFMAVQVFGEDKIRAEIAQQSH